MPLFWWQPFAKDIALWWLAVSALGWLSYPIAFRALILLPDRGLLVSKLIGLALWTFLRAWIAYAAAGGSSEKVVAWGAIGTLGALSALALARAQRPLREWLRERWRLALACEGAFLVAFLAYLWMRSYVPDATFDVAFYGAEKWGNLSILSALWRDPSIPPPDPWLASYALNYYYFSHLIWAGLARLTGVVPSVAFNLGLATIFALLLQGAFAAGWALSERRAGGWWALFFVALAGPLATWSQLPLLFSDAVAGFSVTFEAHGFFPAIHAFFERLGGLDAGALMRSFDFWAPSDVVPNTRNEFPAFNWLLGDLHAHSTGLLLLLLGVCVLAHFNRVRATDSLSWRELAWSQLSSCALLTVVMACMWATNGWDLLVLGALGGVWIAAESMRGRATGTRAGDCLQGMALWVLLGALAIAVLAQFYTRETYMPLEVRNKELAELPSVLGVLGSVGYVETAERTTPAQGFAFWGLLVGCAAALVGGRAVGGLGVWLWNAARRRRVDFGAPAFALLAFAPLAAALAWRDGSTPGAWAVFLAPFLAILIGAGAWAMARRSSLAMGDEWALILSIAALGAILLPEFCFVDDPIGPPYDRYNTVFKLYYPAWALGALAAAIVMARIVALAFPAPREAEPGQDETVANPVRTKADAEALVAGMESRQWRERMARVAPILFIALAIVAGGAYSIAGVGSRVAAGRERVRRLIREGVAPRDALAMTRTLDGLAFMAQPDYAPDDLRLGLWMRDHIPIEKRTRRGNLTNPWIAELSESSYSMTARFAAMTGLPSFLGWPSHESQWRGPTFSRLIWPERNRDLERLYASEDPNEARQIADRCGLRWVVVGSLERRKFADTPEVLEKFERIGRPVKRFGDSVLYDLAPAKESSAPEMPPDWLRDPVKPEPNRAAHD